jgi:Zn-dependent protease
MQIPDVTTLVARIVVLLIAFTIHELAHAVTADRLGDPTPRRMGRITLNPLAHLDPIGTILLILVGFGWAKPVLVNPMNLRGNPRMSMGIVAAAGPLVNIIMAAIGALFVRLEWVDLTSGGFLSLGTFLFVFIQINLILAFFNLIPIPPLDGSKILFALLPEELAYRLRPLEQYGFLLLMGLIFLVPGVLDVLVRAPTQATLRFLLGLG